MVRFGHCVVDLAARTVSVGGRERHLEPQAFDVLSYLIGHRSRVVRKEELLDEVWGDQFVSESALTTRIKEIRQALDDDGVRQAVVRSSRGVGYRFVAPVDGVDAVVVDRDPRLIGRDADIETVIRLLDRAPLVSLVGPGGVGKTTLAEAVGRRVAERRDRGVVTVSLASIELPASVPYVVRAAASVRDATNDAELIAQLAALDVVLVIDNCEHVLEAVAHLVSALVEANGRVRVLATSRERLGVRGEQVCPVAPLAVEDARRLLLARAEAADPGFAWEPGSEAEVARLLAALDRLPLAIEMAAPHLPTIGAAGLADLLADRVDLLRSADPTASERHRTLDALVAWSEKLLDDEQQAVLTALTAFAGPVTAADVAAIAQRDAAGVAVGPLAALVSKSLAVTEGDGGQVGYRLLETVKARAAHRRTADLTAAHAHYTVAELVEADRRLRTPDESASVRRIGALAAEIRSAHVWARANDVELAGEATAALLSYGHERQCLEPVAWAQDLLDDPAVGDRARLAACAALAADASNAGRYDDAAQLGREAVVSDDARVATSALDTLASVGLYVGDFEAAREHGRTLIEVGVAGCDPVAWSQGVLADVLADVYAGRPDAARAALHDHPCPSAIERLMNPTGAAWQAYLRGELSSHEGAITGAVEEYDEAIRLGRLVGSHFVVGVATVSRLAATARRIVDDSTLEAFVPVLEQFRISDSYTHGVTALRTLVPVLVRLGHDEPATVLLGATSSPRVRPAYGAERQRLLDAHESVIQRAGDELAASWFAKGVARDPAWAISHAIGEIEALAGSSHDRATFAGAALRGR
ncbi:MAG: AAA family ATPase [Ilumatobacter sp.]|nr:AAA family ATPase [Ilumatobacter sp.]